VSDAPGGRARRLLVVDDDLGVQRSIGRQLKGASDPEAGRLELSFETDPEKALALLAEEDWDLVLCDIKMKPLSGLEVLARIRAGRPSLPVIMLTGFVDDQIIERAEALGCSDFLIKPVRKEQLLASIFRVLAAAG
jgi:CheY-like chemotaxis protein